MTTKRGLFLLIVVCFSLFALISFSQEEGGEPEPSISQGLVANTDKFAALGKSVEAPAAHGGCDYGSDVLDCFKDTDLATSGLYDYTSMDVIDEGKGHRGLITLNEGKSNIKECNFGSKLVKPPQDQITEGSGCWVLIEERDTSDTSDGAAGIVKEGVIFNSERKLLDHTSEISNILFQCDEAGGDAFLSFTYSLFKTDYPHICAYDKFWHKCEAGVDGEDGKSCSLNTITWANGQMYNCTLDEFDIPLWKPAGVDRDRDFFLEAVDCKDDPSVDPSFCKDVEGPEDCEYPEHSQCAICINPRVKEFAGDWIDNNCDGISIDDPDENEETCVNADQNLFDKSFSWINSNTGNNNCCGDDNETDPLTDFGNIASGTAGNLPGNFICLNNEKPELVGRVGDIPDWPSEKPDGSPDRCAGEWCWVKSDGDAKFHIFTIKKPEQEAYDIVANGQQWVECKNEEGTKEISTGLIFPDDITNANRFYCYKEGNRWSWADCRDPNEPIQLSFNGIKERKPGDGLFSLPIISAMPANKVLIDLDKVYSDYYEDSPTDFIGETYLEFYVRFTHLEEDVPTNVRLSIFGPKQDDGKNVVYFDDSVLGYAANNPVLEENRWIHVKVPISEMVNVKFMRIDASPEKNEIEVRNAYLTSGEKPQICSGEYSSDEGKSSWLTDLDYWQKGDKISGEKLCNALYDPFFKDDPAYQGIAWLGDEEVVAPARRCCGNDDKEYYADDSRDNYGCWNSQPIAPGETTMNVKFSVNSQGKTWEPEYSCSGNVECVYPLPGEPFYTVTNPNPDLYELYFVTNEGEIPVGSSNTYDKDANVKVKKAAQQVIFVNEEDAEGNVDQGFYGCQAASFLEEINKINQENNLPYCSVKGGTFCSYSVDHEINKERFTTINSWSAEEITKVGYAVGEIDTSDLTTFFSNLPFPLKDQSVAAGERNYSTFAFPGQNFLPNAEFRLDGKILPHWDILAADGIAVQNEKEKIVQNKVTLNNGEILRSERIAIGKNTNVSFSHNGSCSDIQITLVDKDGNRNIASPPEFSTAYASYLVIEFKGTSNSCTIFQPLLQYVDNQGKSPYHYKSQPSLTGFDARSGAACCSQNSCWNGYACVEDMSASALVEHLPDDRNYRCVQGIWKYQPLKQDWNREKSGFCNSEDQCFVLSTESASVDAATADFYQGEYPSCINSGEYVFDNYCQAGNWTSRTKFVAEELVNVAGDDDFVLYCTSLREAELETAGKENYLEGIKQVAVAGKVGLAETLGSPGGQEVTTVCFDALLDKEGARLVPEKENTCVNNFCVLQHKGKTSFATTLNRDITDPDSFFLALGIPQGKIKVLCAPSGENEFVKCDVTGTAVKGDLWYSQKLNAVIYGKEGFSLEPGLVEKVWEKIKNLFGVESELSQESIFVAEVQNFRDVYLLKKDEKFIRAVREVFSPQKQTLIAEYENFETPVCEYVTHVNLPEDLELLEEAAGQQQLSCTQQKAIQHVEAISNFDLLWPQLTGKVRVN